MNMDPPREFDPGEALALFAEPDSERYGLSDRAFFYLLVTCKAIDAFAEPAFTIEAVLNPKDNAVIGCFVEFIVKQAFWIDVSPERVKLWTASADDAEVRSRYLVHDGASDNPAAWESFLQAIGRVEKFGVIVNHADRLRQMWSEWLVEQKRRRDERGW